MSVPSQNSRLAWVGHWWTRWNALVARNCAAEVFVAARVRRRAVTPAGTSVSERLRRERCDTTPRMLSLPSASVDSPYGAQLLLYGSYCPLARLLRSGCCGPPVHLLPGGCRCSLARRSATTVVQCTPSLYACTPAAVPQLLFTEFIYCPSSSSTVHLQPSSTTAVLH